MIRRHALFYGRLPHSGYWLMEYVSISRLTKAADRRGAEHLLRSLRSPWLGRMSCAEIEGAMTSCTSHHAYREPAHAWCIVAFRPTEPSPGGNPGSGRHTRRAWIHMRGVTAARIGLRCKPPAPSSCALRILVAKNSASVARAPCSTRRRPCAFASKLRHLEPLPKDWNRLK